MKKGNSFTGVVLFLGVVVPIASIVLTFANSWAKNRDIELEYNSYPSKTLVVDGSLQFSDPPKKLGGIKVWQPGILAAVDSGENQVEFFNAKTGDKVGEYVEGGDSKIQKIAVSNDKVFVSKRKVMERSIINDDIRDTLSVCNKSFHDCKDVNYSSYGGYGLAYDSDRNLLWSANGDGKSLGSFENKKYFAIKPREYDNWKNFEYRDLEYANGRLWALYDDSIFEIDADSGKVVSRTSLQPIVEAFKKNDSLEPSVKSLDSLAFEDGKFLVTGEGLGKIYKFTLN